MKRLVYYSLLPLILGWTIVVYLFHAGVFAPPEIRDGAPARATWLDKSRWGIHHLILAGPPYGRGLEAGRLTKDLMARQEEVLNRQFETWLPKRWMRQAAVLFAIGWFQGIEKYFAPEHLEEMYGTSKSATPRYDYLVDGYTRQVAYHGLHEVGQMMVDQGFEAMGCTVAFVRRGSNWVLGRNFDFEGGRIFDEEKILKWVFPDRGYPFVSVIWAGMVGAVTGVNARGVYISINAAGSEHFRRVGTPSTLVTLEVLQHAATTEEAIEIIRRAPMFITDIFVVNDRAGHLVRIEKSPRLTEVTPMRENGAVANHLLSPAFARDSNNRRRLNELTTRARLDRAESLARAVPIGLDLDQTAQAVLNILRDKGVDAANQPLHLGNRRAIDALIATHAVVWDGVRQRLYVGEGPSLTGAFRGYDLTRSFAAGRPVEVPGFDSDPLVPAGVYVRHQSSLSQIRAARRLLLEQKCLPARDLLEEVPATDREQPAYHHVLGDTYACTHAHAQALVHWQRALDLTPAYAKEENELRRRLKGGG